MSKARMTSGSVGFTPAKDRSTVNITPYQQRVKDDFMRFIED